MLKSNKKEREHIDIEHSVLSQEKVLFGKDIRQ